MIFVLLGRRNALCLARHNRAKRAKISRFQACSDRSLYPNEKMPPLPAAFRMCNYLLSLVLSHFWFAIPQLVLQADWQEVWHSPQPPFFALSQRLLVFKVVICFILVTPYLKICIISNIISRQTEYVNGIFLYNSCRVEVNYSVFNEFERKHVFTWVEKLAFFKLFFPYALHVFD